MQTQENNNTTLSVASLSKLGILLLQGVGASNLLQGQITIDINHLSDFNAKLAALCNSKGRVISLFDIVKAQDFFYLIMEKSLIDLTYCTLKKFAPFYKVDLIIPNYQVYFSREPITSSQHVIHAKIAYLSDRASWYYHMTSDTHDHTSVDTQEFDLSKIKQLIPSLFKETSSLFLPHELNLQHLSAIDFNKGCFTGQEIIARMHYRAKLKKRLCHLVFSEKLFLTPGQEIYAVSKHTAGNIICYHHQNEHTEALVLLADEYINENCFSLDPNVNKIINSKIIKETNE